MFAVKQLTRCLPSGFLTAAAFKVHPCHGAVSGIMFLRQLPPIGTSPAYFSCSKLCASTTETFLQPAASIQPVPVQNEPDVLYRMIEIEIRSSEKAVLQSYNKFITLTAEHLGLNIGLCEISKKPHIRRWTVLKSRFVHNKHWVSYEVRTFHHKIQIDRITGSTADTFLEYIQRNLPEGVSMRVGKERMEKLPDHLLSPPPAEELEDK